MTTPNDDPFTGGDKAPAMSFKDAPIGTTHTIDVSEAAKHVQQRNFDTDQPDFWPPNSDGSPGKPKMAAVYNGVDGNGEPISLWCPNPSDLFAKMKAHEVEYRAKGAAIGAGKTIERIHVRLQDRVPAKNPKYMKSIYLTKVESIGPKVTAPAGDPFGGQPAEPDPWSAPPAAPVITDEPPF